MRSGNELLFWYYNLVATMWIMNIEYQLELLFSSTNVVIDKRGLSKISSQHYVLTTLCATL